MATPGTWPSSVELHLAHRHHGVGERGHEQPDRQLARLVAQERLHDPRRELPHRQLHDDHRDRQHQRRQRDHRHGDRRQNAHRGIGPARQPPRNQVEPRRTVDRQRDQRQQQTGQHAQHRDEPQARPHTGASGTHGAACTRCERPASGWRHRHRAWSCRGAAARSAPRCHRGLRCPRALTGDDRTARSTCRTSRGHGDPHR